MRKLFSRLILPLLLLLAQQGAMLHELNHFAASQTQQESDHGQHAVSGLCSVCLAFSQVGTTALPEAVKPGLLRGLAFHGEPDSAVQAHARDLPSQRSRGPPTFL